MEVLEVSGGAQPVVGGGGGVERANSDRDQVLVQRKTLDAVLDKWKQTLELLTTGSIQDDDESEYEATDDDGDSPRPSSGCRRSSPPSHDGEADVLCSLLKSRVECREFLEKLESAETSIPRNLAEESNSWDMVDENDLWERGNSGSNEEDYVLVEQNDIAYGIACFMAAYLLSHEETKDVTPNQLRDALTKTFSMKKKKGKLRKAWEGSKVIYNVTSWGTTAIGIYQNPVILRAASTAFWTSCHVISKLF